MCGRFLLLTSGKDVAEEFDLAGPPELFPRNNIAPTQPVAAVRAAETGRELVRLRWGLVPPWSRDTKVAPINARAETAADKPMFRSALRKRRCLIPASGFYDWLALAGAKRKQPYCFRPRDERPWAFAGLWERWQGPDGPVESCCILTTEANELVRPVHDRMPVILPERHWAAWLDPQVQDAGEVVPLLRPYPADAMRAYAVGQLVSNPRNDGPECLAPASPKRSASANPDRDHRAVCPPGPFTGFSASSSFRLCSRFQFARPSAGPSKNCVDAISPPRSNAGCEGGSPRECWVAAMNSADGTYNG